MSDVNEAMLICIFVFAVLGFTVAVFALIEVKAMQRSTHKIQFVDPWKQEMEEIGQEFEELTDEKKRKIRDAQHLEPVTNQEDEDDVA